MDWGTLARGVSEEKFARGLWLVAFAFLYGVRLLARSRTFRLGFDIAPAIAPAVWDYGIAAITYLLRSP